MLLNEMEEYDEVMRRFLEVLPVERRFAGLDAEQILLALPDSALRALSPEYVATLSEPTRNAIQKRLSR
jgi:hypothetical protein